MMRHNQQKALAQGTLFLFSLLLFSFYAYANPNWNNWGNMGVDYASNLSEFFRGTAFASNYPAGTTNFTHITITDGMSVTPLVYDFNHDGQNEVMTFFTSSARLYDHNGNFLDSFTFNGTVCGNPNIINFNSDAYAQAVIMTSASGGYWYHIIGTYSTTFYNIKSYFLNTSTYGSYTSNCDLFGGVDFPTHELWSVNTNSSVVSYNPDTDAVTLYANPTSSVGYTQFASTGAPFFHGGACAIKYGANPNIYFPSNGSTYGKMNRFNTDTKTFTFTQTINSAVGMMMMAICGNLGSYGSSPEIIYTALATGSNNMFYMVMGYDLSTQANYSLTSVAVGTSLGEKSNPIIADINLDGVNEYCLKTSDLAVKCYTSTSTLIFFTNFTSGEADGIISAGLYDNTSSYMQLITGEGIYSINVSGMATNIYNFSHPSSMPMPVGVENRNSFKKDLLMVQDLQIDYYIGTGTPAVCGNGVCEYSENPITCSADCFNTPIPNGSAYAGTVANFQYCDNSTWCLSNSCIQNVCTPISSGGVCTSDAQCQSGDCDGNNHCTSSGFVSLTKDFLGLAFGFGFFDLLFLGLMLILFFAVCGALLGACLNFVAAIALGFIGAIIGLMMSVFVFAFIPVWFFVILLFLLILTIGLIIFYSGSGG